MSSLYVHNHTNCTKHITRSSSMHRPQVASKPVTQMPDCACRQTTLPAMQAVRRTVRPGERVPLPWLSFLFGSGVTALGFAAYE